jgi:urate oxidase
MFSWRESSTAHVEGDNGPCLATDDEEPVYALARQDAVYHIESFALRLADHFIAKPAVSRVRINAVEQPWTRLAVNGRPHPHAFVQPGGEQWTSVVTRDARQVDVVSGLTNLVLLKTTDSSGVSSR